MSSIPTLAGSVSTAFFVVATLPMLWKAAVTRDLSSYSIGNIALANAGNLVHAVYIVSLPPGPIWALHGFNLSTSGLMLVWYLRHHGVSGTRKPVNPTDSHDLMEQPVRVG